MSINAATTSSSQVSSSSASSQVTTSANADNAKKSSTDSSFKDEMDKVSTKEQASSEKNTSEMSEKNEAADVNTDSNNNESTTAKTEESVFETSIDYTNFASLSVLDANSMLTNDIKQIIGLGAIQDMQSDNLFNTKSFTTLDFSTSLSISESDANFFLGLTKNNDISMANITTQAQVMLNNGADVAEVKQNVQISQTLLDAISKAKDNNQPLRIDFDQNISVILRISKEGVVSANFIPGDKAVEQYLRNNISSLKATFDEQDLPYSDLSYSNRGSKQQKENRKNNNK